MSKKLSYYLSLILCISAPLPQAFAAYPSVEAYESKRIATIEVIMENLPAGSSFDQKTVLSRLKTKTGDPFSQLTFDSDLKALSEEYDRVEPLIEVHNGEVYITLKVWPRPKIRTIKWSGNENVKTKKLQKELGIKPNSIYNRQAFNKAFNKLKEYYIKNGYFESQLQYTVHTDPKTNEVDIEVTVREGRSGRIENIIFKGFTKAEKSQLLDMIYTKKYNFLTSWLTGEGTYNEEAVEQDQLTVINFLQDKGYADAKVTIRVLEAKNPGKIALEISADRGQIFHFGKVTFKGNELFDNKKIEQYFLVRPKGVYSPEKLRQTAQNIKDLYGRKGFIEANVQYETELVEDKPIYNVHFTINEGEEFKIGMIRVFGNVQTQTSVILRESLLVPGETFDSAKLKATQARLENIGYFKSVNVYAIRTQDDQTLGENYRDVFIEVTETTTGNISLFAGFSSSDDVFGGLDLTETNFNYKGLGKVFSKGPSAVRGGGEYAHARFSLGEKQESFLVSWMTPYFRDTLWRIGFDVTQSISNLQSEDYDIRTIGTSVYASYPLTHFWTFGTKYRLKDSNVHLHDLTKKERKEVDKTGIISAIASTMTYDSTDSMMKPHNGFRSLIEAEFAGLGGPFTFFRVGYINTYYTSLWPRGIMKYRFDFRFIEPVWKSNEAEDIPLSERFFIGGEASVRGYRAFDLGSHFPNGDPKGGISSSVLSVEYLHEVFRFMDLFVFADAGSVSLHRFSLDTYRLSYGFGTRLELINRVPVILGMGYPVNPDGRSEVRKFFFSMGGQF